MDGQLSAIQILPKWTEEWIIISTQHCSQRVLYNQTLASSSASLCFASFSLSAAKSASCFFRSALSSSKAWNKKECILVVKEKSYAICWGNMYNRNLSPSKDFGKKIVLFKTWVKNFDSLIKYSFEIDLVWFKRSISKLKIFKR